jgi:ABC-2 type transport system permease protein
VSAGTALLDAEPADPPLERLGRPIKGPSALGSDPRRLWHLTWTLARTEFKLAFFDSVLGYLWQLVRPLLLFGVIYALFVVVLNVSSGPFFGAYLLLGVVLFTFVSESTGGGVTSLLDRENLVRKIEFPRLAVPSSVVLRALFTLGLNLIVAIVFLFASGGHARWSWLELPLLVLLLAGFAAGLAMILSVAYVRYRDVKPIWEVVLQVLFYGSPIFYRIDKVAHHSILGIKASYLLMANPFVAILQQAQHATTSAQYMSARSALGGGALVLIPIGIWIAVVVGGYVLFDRQAPYVAEQL